MKKFGMWKLFVPTLLAFLLASCGESALPEPAVLQDEVAPETVVSIAPAEKGVYGNSRYWEGEVYFRFKEGAPMDFVTYGDGHTENLPRALAAGRVTLADLDRLGVAYIRIPLPDEHSRCVRVVDLHQGEGRADAIDAFFEDEYNVYYFPYLQSDGLIVCYDDGSEEPLVRALRAGRVDVSVLDDNGFSYGIDPRHGAQQTIADISFPHGVPEDTGEIEQFFCEGDSVYCFPSHWSSDILVYYEMGACEPITYALRAGRAVIEDLDRFGIEYLTLPRAGGDKQAAVLRISLEGAWNDNSTAEEIFHADAQAWYVFEMTGGGQWRVYYTDHSQERVAKAFDNYHLTLADLDRLGIPYAVRPRG